MLRLSNYVEVLRDCPEKGTATLVDLTSGRSAVVSADTLSSRDEVPVDLEGFYTNMSPLEEGTAAADRLRKAIAGVRSMSLTILPTYDCNFGCGYCFSQVLRNPAYMSRHVVEAFSHWLRIYIEQNAISSLRVSFYGGEPLLAKSQVMDILDAVQMISSDCKIPFRASIATNGSLLSPNTAQDLAEAGMTAVSITVDGGRAAHDRRRPFKVGAPSWYSVVEGILSSLKILSTTIRVNIDPDNGSAVRCLAEELWAPHPEMYQRVPMYLYPVEKVCESQNCYLDLGNREASQVLVRAWEDQIACGIGFRPVYPFGICQFHSPHSFTLSPDGLLYQCPGTTGRTDYLLGDLCRHCLDRTIITWSDSCKRCKYLFFCGGGCHGTGYRNCRRVFLSTVVKEYMRLKLFSNMKVISC
jgi:uncharacterized protein